ncbi:DUF397 domain-containing protein [Streptomyces sp. GbtcB6]|uniref:DUF397 domain-containing protein n=1 Tax=Streptomyces sp. GbtcB6 TaxID=2824751 RepID=UPI001C30057A|nr:DUF397 domain-containing protein [Streptomyces sp. GbtcB6]
MIRKTTAEDASGLTWFKSSYIRDSKKTATPSRGPHRTFPPATWTAFLSYPAAGE